MAGPWRIPYKFLTTIIGWLGMVGCAFGVIAHYVQASEAVGKNTALMIVAAVGVINAGVGFFMAIILLRGSGRNDPKALENWTLYALSAAAIMTCCSIVGVIQTEADLVSSIIGQLTFLGTQGFFVWVVSRRKRQIEDEIGKKN